MPHLLFLLSRSMNRERHGLWGHPQGQALGVLDILLKLEDLDHRMRHHEIGILVLGLTSPF